MSSHSPLLLWARDGAIRRGTGSTQWIDPGVGPGRYQRALAALKDSGAETAMASFTFDPDEVGSVVAIPEAFEEVDPSQVSGQLPLNGAVVTDGYPQWRAGWSKAMESIQSEVVEKVVLTRQMDLRFESNIDQSAVVSRLIETEIDSFAFAVDGLIGASPELLVSLSAGRVISLALAGTAAQSSDLQSEKMDREHAFSLSSVETGIAPHVRSLDVAPRTAMRFGEINHLGTRFSGAVNNGTTALDILSTLHPTAAVAGTPLDTSLKTIKDIESRPRGRYAGPVGWFNCEGEGEFAIALRCGLVNGSDITLFAGGGIIAGSSEPTEYAETDLKLQPMLRALGLR